MKQEQRVTVSGRVAVKNPGSLKLWTPIADVWLGRAAILDCDTEFDEIEAGTEITIEIPLWLARKEGLAE